MLPAGILAVVTRGLPGEDVTERDPNATRSTARAGQALRAPAAHVRIAELAGPGEYAVQPPNLAREPWPGQYRTLAGTDIFVRTTPTTNPDAEPTLYVHGLGGASTNFTDLAELLSPWFAGEAIDLPGFGRSGPPASGDYSIAAHARIVVECLEQAGRGPVHLVGNSMGGAISIVVAATRPDLVRSLTLISPAVPDRRPRSGGDALMPLMLVPALGRRVLQRLERVPPERRARAVIELCFAHPERVPANRMAEAAADVAERRGMHWANDALLQSLRGLVRTYFARGNRSPWRLMATISCPTLVIWGERDRLVSASHGPRVATTIPDATLLLLSDVGHTAQLEDPTVTARAILALRSRLNDGFAE